MDSKPGSGLECDTDRVIADLLAALETMLAFAIPGVNWTDETGQEIKNQARSAIAKAKARKNITD